MGHDGYYLLVVCPGNTMSYEEVLDDSCLQTLSCRIVAKSSLFTHTHTHTHTHTQTKLWGGGGEKHLLYFVEVTLFCVGGRRFFEHRYCLLSFGYIFSYSYCFIHMLNFFFFLISVF